MSRRIAWLLWVTAAVVSAVIGLFFRADTGPEAWPLLYPMLATAAVLALLLLVRALRPLLETRSDDDAD